MEKSLDRNTTDWSTLTCSSKNLRDACSSITSRKLIYALIRFHTMFAFKIVHRRGADRTLNHLVLIEHRKLNDHSIEVEAPHLASPQRHCQFSTLKEVIVPR
jgi:hypothetical protein